MLPTVYGYADQKDVEQLIKARAAAANSAEEIGDLLGGALFALLEINNSIPVHAKQRHLVASALENFAEGK